MIRNRIIILLGLASILSGCSYQTYISIETLEPPMSYYLNPTNPITVNYNYSPSNRLPKILGNRNDIDSLASDFAASAITSSIKQNSLYPQTNVVTTQLQLDDSRADKDFVLSEGDISKIAKKTNGEVILSLDYFSLSPEITAFPSSAGGYASILVVDAVGAWRAYSTVSKRVVGEFVFKQVYNWDGSGGSKQLAINSLPNLNEVASWVGSECGTTSAKAFAPFWNTVYRSIFVGVDAKWVQAKNYAKIGDWENAVKIWSWQVGGSKTPKLKWQAAYNLAVASEVQNDLMLAISWLDVADSLIPSTSEVSKYREIIQLRLKSQKLLESFK